MLLSEWGSINKETLTRDQSDVLIKRGIHRKFASVWAEEVQTFPGTTKVRQKVKYKLFCFQDLLRVLPKVLDFGKGQRYRLRIGYECMDHVEMLTKGQWIVGYFNKENPEQYVLTFKYEKELIDALYALILDGLLKRYINPYELEDEA